MACACSAKKSANKNSSLRQITKRTPITRTKSPKKMVRKRLTRPLY